MTYSHVVFSDDYEMFGAVDMSLLFKALKAAGYQLGMIARTMMERDTGKATASGVCTARSTVWFMRQERRRSRSWTEGC